MASFDAEELTAYFSAREPEMLDALQRLVEMESPSDDLTAIEELALALSLYVESSTGCEAEVLRSGPYERPHVLTRLGERIDVLFIGHFDTVHPVGTIIDFPFRIEDGHAYGPGVLDMKAGLVIMTETARYLSQHVKSPNLGLLWTSDEEVGMFDSKLITRALAEEAKLVVIFEYTSDESEVKIGSRGDHPYRITIHGRGGHAAYPEDLSNPIEALGEVIAVLRDINHPESGQVVVPTIVEAGNKANAVPESVTLTIDVRYSDSSALTNVENALSSIKFGNPDFLLTYESLQNTPLFKADANSEAFALAKDAALEFGVDLRGIEARGASDMNQAGTVNKNVIEAFGGMGRGAHSAGRERVLIDSLARRAALTTLMTHRALDR